jgi:hypothetical protein
MVALKVSEGLVRVSTSYFVFNRVHSNERMHGDTNGRALHSSSSAHSRHRISEAKRGQQPGGAGGSRRVVRAIWMVMMMCLMTVRNGGVTLAAPRGIYCYYSLAPPINPLASCFNP